MISTKTPIASRSPANAMGLTNEELRQRVLRFLNSRGIRGVEDVDVDVDGGIVVLRGRISSAHEHWLCVTCARHVAGVIRVLDELEIEHKKLGTRRAK